MYIKVYGKHTLIKSRDQPPLVLAHAVFSKIVLGTQQYYHMYSIITCTVLSHVQYYQMYSIAHLVSFDHSCVVFLSPLRL